MQFAYPIKVMRNSKLKNVFLPFLAPKYSHVLVMIIHRPPLPMCKYPTSFAVQDSVTANNDREPPPSLHCSSKWLMRNCLLAVVKAITFSSEVLALATCVNQFICHKACLKGILTQGGTTILVYY